MHGLETMALLNREAVEKYRAKSQDAIEAEEEAPTFTIEDIENARQEALQEGNQEAADDAESAYESGQEEGYSDGHAEGYEEAEEKYAGAVPLLDLLNHWGINPLEPFTAVYDAAVKAIVFHQGDATVVFNK